MKHHITTWACVWICLSVIGMGSSTAETEEDKTKPQQLETITVTADSLSGRRDLDPDSTQNPYRVETSARVSTEVFSQEKIKDLRPKDLNDLLDKAVGLNVTYQGRKSPYFISQRGGGSFTYIIDGAVLPPSTNRILFRIPLAAIEELQVIRGSTSLTLGPSIPIGASGSGSGLNTGYIIIRTKRSQKTEASLTASAEQGTGGHPTATNVSVYAGTHIEASSLVDGYIGGLLATMDRPGKDTWFDGQSSEGGMAGTGFRAGKLSLNMMAYHDSGRFEMQRGVTVDGVLSDVKWYYDPLKTTVFSGDMCMTWTPDQTTLLNVFQTKYEQEEHNDSFISDSMTVKHYEEKTRGLGLRHNARFGVTLFQVGGQYSNSTGFGPNTSKAYNRYDTTVTGWSASVEQGLFDGRLTLDGGYRQDTKHIDNSSTSPANDDANNDVDMAPAKIITLGSLYRITDMFSLDGRYFHGEQGTTGDFDMRAESGELHREKQDRIEVSFSADVASYVKPVLTWFSIDTENAKSATHTTYELDGGTYYFYTESDTLRRGLELMINGNIGKNTSYKMSWTRMLDIETTKGGETTDSIGVSNPENLYSISLKHTWKAYTANLSVKKVDKWTDTSSAMGLAESGGLGDYTRVDANIQWDVVIKDLLLNLTVYGRNLTDEHYSTRYVTGFYADRGCVLGAEVTLNY
ncbi:MAG: TonB-dependent receptor plug domain-containing protein [Proteobacteria bacterium]|nr:TonB-dependent receptor plug domain-containing protein [Pseudomonadota bacterium]